MTIHLLTRKKKSQHITRLGVVERLFACLVEKASAVRPEGTWETQGSLDDRGCCQIYDVREAEPPVVGHFGNHDSKISTRGDCIEKKREAENSRTSTSTSWTEVQYFDTDEVVVCDDDDDDDCFCSYEPNAADDD